MMSQNEKEIRSHLELRAVGRTLIGTIPYNSVTSLGKFNEQIAPGAFAGSLKPNVDVRALHEHNDALIMGRKSNGTLTFTDSPTELRFEVTPPEGSPMADHLIASVANQTIKNTSFGFSVEPGGQLWDRTKNLRTITNARLWEVSFVGNPAYGDSTASIALRSCPFDKEDEAINEWYANFYSWLTSKF